MSFSDYLENKVLDHVFGASTYGKPTLYVALFTAAPSDAGGGTEVAGGSYARMACGAMTVSGTNPTQAVNAASFEFPTATADWGTITHAAIFDAAVGGNMLDWAPLTTQKTVLNGDAMRFPAGELKITLD